MRPKPLIPTRIAISLLAATLAIPTTQHQTTRQHPLAGCPTPADLIDVNEFNFGRTPAGTKCQATHAPEAIDTNPYRHISSRSDIRISEYVDQCETIYG